MLKEKRIVKLSTQEVDENHKPISDERSVERKDFEKFIVEKIEIESEIKNEVNIEIVSPVLKSDKLKWKGLYNSSPISFNLSDPVFQQSVIKGEISFTNGTTIKCDLEFQRSMEDNGEIKISQVIVSNVIEVFEGERKIEIPKTKKPKNIGNQISLFGQ